MLCVRIGNLSWMDPIYNSFFFDYFSFLFIFIFLFYDLSINILIFCVLFCCTTDTSNLCHVYLCNIFSTVQKIQSKNPTLNTTVPNAMNYQKLQTILIFLISFLKTKKKKKSLFHIQHLENQCDNNNVHFDRCHDCCNC